MISLLVLQGPDKGRRFELPDAVALIGRESRQLPLTDQTISRRHAELSPENEAEWVLRDLASSNGTYVNGQRVERAWVLKQGDQIRVGRSLMAVGIQTATRSISRNVRLADADAGMDSSIINTMPGNDDSMVLAVPEPAQAAMSNLKMLYRLSAVLAGSFKIDQVLEVVMDLVFEHVRADRGILMLLQPDGTLDAKVARVRDETGRRKPGDAEPAATPEHEKPEHIPASHTIIKHVITKGAGVLSSNAMSDPRFSKGKSVQNLGIRSCMCVPIKARKVDLRQDDPGTGDEVIGVIYIDSSVRNYSYSTDQLRLLTSIGLQAGMAIQNAALFQAGLEAERLAAIGETTAALSHSIKNILQALRGGADVVEIGLRRTDVIQATKGWQIVNRNLDKIFNLTMNLLAYSRPRLPKLEMIHPGRIIDECLELIAPTANSRGVMAVADVDPGVPAVPIDPDGFHQVLMNLLTNALDAVAETKDGDGLIRVACRYDPAAKAVFLDVIDNGRGIPPSMKGHLFKIFHSTKGNRGTGLGLATAKKIVDEHQGQITASSKPGEGTTFSIKLPAYHINAEDLADTRGPGV